jgi:hypothetical protein
MQMRIRHLSVAAVAALLLTACGGNPLDDRTGPEVADAAADALEKAGAVRVQGTLTQDGEEGEVDLQLQGEDASGTIGFGGMELQLISVGGTAYLQAPPEFWSSFGLPAEAAAQFEGQWVTVPAEAAGQVADFSLNAFVEELRNPSSEVKDEVEDGERDGEPVVVVEQEDGGTLTVANDEPAYPLQVTEEGDSPSEVSFSGFGEEEEIEAPADALDLEDLAGSGS